jgi:hypothetical protein
MNSCDGRLFGVSGSAGVFVRGIRIRNGAAINKYSRTFVRRDDGLFMLKLVEGAKLKLREGGEIKRRGIFIEENTAPLYIAN